MRASKKREIAPEDLPSIVQANQYQNDPRQLEFIKNYTTLNSGTFGNAYQSALKAGYSDSYAKVVTNQTSWLSQVLKGLSITQGNVLAALAEESMDKEQNKGYERIKALELIGKHIGMFTVERHNDVSGEIVIRLGSNKSEPIEGEIVS